MQRSRTQGGEQTTSIAQMNVTLATQVLTAEDLNGLQKCVFDWADSYDHKDYERLARIGNPAVLCQHLVGASHWEWIGLNEIQGRHQIRAAHQVYTDAILSEVKLKGHAHASNIMKVHKDRRHLGSSLPWYY